MRRRFALGLDTDLSAVRVHAGPDASSLARHYQAQAYTIGTDIVVDDQQSLTGTAAGTRLLAHEVAHVVQTGGVASGSGVSSPGDPVERAADQMATRLLAHRPPANVSPLLGGIGPRVRRQGTATTDAPAEASVDVLPAPMLVTWGTDPFHVSFARTPAGDRLEVTVRYEGTLPFDGPGVQGKNWKASVEIGRALLAARIREQTPTSVQLDLYGDSSHLLRIGDTASVDTRPPTPGRQHDLALSLSVGGGTYGSVWVRDSKVQPGDIPAVKLTDSPGSNPASTSVPGDWDITQILLDGDGDQRKELLLRLRAERGASSEASTPLDRRVKLSLQQATGEAMLDAVGELAAPATSAHLFPLVRSVTDGHAATRISLVTPLDTQWLTIAPPDHTAPAPAYVLDWAGRRDTVPARTNPAGPLGKVPVAGMIGGILYNDAKLGAYDDGFRLTLQPIRTQKALLGISPLFRGEALGGYGVEIPISAVVHFQTVSSGPVSVGFDLDGDGNPDLQLFDQLTTPADYDGGGPPERNRNHKLRLVGAAAGGEKTFDFQIRDGYPRRAGNAGAESKAVASNAMAVSGLREEAKHPTFEAQLDAYESAMMRVRADAARSGALSQKTYDAWAALSADMIRLRPQIAAADVQAPLQAQAAAHAGAFFAALSADIAATEKSFGRGVVSTTVNEYTGETRTTTLAHTTSVGAGPRLVGEITAGTWVPAFADYQTLVTGLDKWVVHRLKVTKGEHDKSAEQAQYLVSSRGQLADLERFSPERVLAVFHPDQQFSAEGEYRPQFPLNLYYYRDGDTWYLKNLTNPDHPHHYTVPAAAGEAAPPASLFLELDDPDRLPAGVVHYDIPGVYASQVKITPQLTWRGFLTWLGIGLAVVGLSLATLGTGTVAVVGSWALAGSAIAGGLSAAIDIAEHLEHGDLTATTAVLDIAQIVASVAGVTALRAGTLAKGGLVAAAEGNPLTGAAAATAVAAQRVYIISTATRVAADVVTVATMAIDAAGRLDEIQNGPGDQTSKDRAKALLLAQLAVTGGLTALSIKGELPAIGNGRKLALFTPKGETVPRAIVEGMEAPSTLRFSQKDIGGATSEGMPMEDLITSMRTEGWKGDALQVVELPDGTRVSLDNRRLYAAQKAGLTDVPVQYHAPSEPFPQEWAAAGFELKDPIRRLPDGSLVVGGKHGEIAYAKGAIPATYGEAALFRTANQGKIPGAGRFPLWGSLELPRVRPVKAKAGTPGGTSGAPE